MEHRQGGGHHPNRPPRFVSGWSRHPFGEGFSSGNSPAGRDGADRSPVYAGADEFGVPLGRDARALFQPEPAPLRNGGFNPFFQRPAHRDGADVLHHFPLREPVRRQSQRPTGRALRQSGTDRGNQAGLSLTVRFLRTAVTCRLRPGAASRPSSTTQRRRTRSAVALPAFRDRAMPSSFMAPPGWYSSHRSRACPRENGGCGHESACKLPPVLWTPAP